MQTDTRTPRDISVACLGNGIRVITETMLQMRSVSIGVWVASGSRNETASENGISHFIEHMLFQGSARRSAEDIARITDSIGGHLDAFTGKELTGFTAKVLDQNLPLVFDVVSDLILNPVFREADIEKEKGVILEELKMDFDNPEYYIHELFVRNFWKSHALGRSIIGTRKTIKSFQSDKLREYHRRCYVPSNIVVTAAGNLRHDEFVKLAENAFGHLPNTGPLPPENKPHTHALIELRNKRSLHQVHLYLGTPSYPLAHDRRHICYVLNTILGAGMSSRLFQNIRERQGLAYAVMSDLNMYRDTGYLAVYAGTSIENARRLIDSVMHEFRALRETPVGEDELRRAKDHLKGSLVLGLESTSSRMTNLARQQIYFGKFTSMDEMLDSIERVTAGEVQEVANDFFRPEAIALTVLGRLEGFKFEREDLSN